MNGVKAANHIRTIFKREIAGYFGSPVAYVFIVIFLLLTGFFTFNISRFFETGQADLSGFFEWHPWIFLFLVPAVAMRLWAEEKRLGTLEIIMTLPVTLFEAVVGKFLAAWAFIGIALLLTFPVPATAAYLGDPDLGAVLAGYLGSFLMAGAFLSVGAMTSALTRSQVVSFILSVAVCLFFLLAGYPPVTEFLTGWAPSALVNLVTGMSFFTHFHAIQRGVADLRDVFYYLSVMGFSLYANAFVLKSVRA